MTTTQSEYLDDNALSDDDLHAMYNAHLDECYMEEWQAAPSWMRSGKGPAAQMEDCSPVDYRCGFVDWLDSMTRDGQLYAVDSSAGEVYLTPYDYDEYSTLDADEETDD